MNEPLGSREREAMQALAMLALALATFSRLLESTFGLPRLINWLHFPLVVVAFLWSLRRIDRDAAPLYATVGALFAVFVLSGLFNGAGLANVLLGFVLLAEPFLLLAILVNGLPGAESIRSLRRFLLLLALVQIPVSLTQLPHALAVGKGDLVQGTFRGMGAGHHVMGAIAAIAALYVLGAFAIRPRWVAWAAALLLSSLVVLSDSKQVILAFVLGYALLRAPSARSARRMAALAARVLLLVALVYAVQWAVGKDAYFYQVVIVLKGFAAKFSIFSVLASHFGSPLGWAFGLGPGHGVSRMGGWLLDQYWSLLEPLGATRTNVAREAWQHAQPYGLRSSFFVPLFSWAGIFGDVGLAGLGAYATLLGITYRRYCREDLSRLLLLVIVLFGFVFEWLEEYNFMLYAVAVIAERWQTHASRSAAACATPRASPEALRGADPPRA